MIKQAYINGFMRKCAERRVNPGALLKMALDPANMGSTKVQPPPPPRYVAGSGATSTTSAPPAKRTINVKAGPQEVTVGGSLQKMTKEQWRKVIESYIAQFGTSDPSSMPPPHTPEELRTWADKAMPRRSEEAEKFLLR